MNMNSHICLLRRSQRKICVFKLYGQQQQQQQHPNFVHPVDFKSRSFLPVVEKSSGGRFGIAPQQESSQVDGDGCEESLRSRTIITIISITARLSRELKITGWSLRAHRTASVWWERRVVVLCARVKADFPPAETSSPWHHCCARQVDFYAQRRAHTLSQDSAGSWLLIGCARRACAYVSAPFPRACVFARLPTYPCASHVGWGSFVSIILFVFLHLFYYSAFKETPSLAESPVPEITAWFAQQFAA